MKDLKELKKLLILSLTNIILYANGVYYLNKEEKQSLSTQKEINSLSSKNLKRNWIEPIVASYSYTKNNSATLWQKSRYFRVSLNQPIFKSGGIYFAIKYAKANSKFRELSTSLEQNRLIRKLYELVLNLKKLDNELKQTKLKLKNRDLDIKRKKERFLSGDDDISFLNQAMLSKNSLLLTLSTLKTKKRQLLNNLKTISPYSYKSITLPSLTLISKDEFLSKNLELKKQIYNLKQTKELKNMTISNYLATISLIADYNYQKTKLGNAKWQKKEYKNYGLQISIPFSLNEGRDIEIKKLEVIKEKLTLAQKRRDLKSEYKNIYLNIQNLKEKISIIKKNINLYNSLIKVTKDRLKAGDSTKEDLKTLQNSKRVLTYDLISTQYDIKLEILKLFEKMSDEI